MENLPSLRHSGNSLQDYINSISNIPVLSKEEEDDLIKRYYYEHDLEAAKKLIISHLRFVVFIARKYQGYNLPQEDLIQEGNIGLMEAVKKFDPTIGVRLATYAAHWIRARIQEYVMKNWRLVKNITTKNQKKLFYNLKKNKSTNSTLTYNEALSISKQLNVSVDEVIEMDTKFMHNEESMSSELSPDTNHLQLEDTLYNEGEDPAEQFENQSFASTKITALHQAIETLNPRDKDIIKERWLNEEKSSLKDLATKYNISIERTRQIEAKALQHIKDFVNKK